MIPLDGLTPEADPKPDPEAQPATLPYRQGSWFIQMRRYAWPILCLFQFGVVAGLGVALMRSGSSEVTKESPEHVEHSKAVDQAEAKPVAPARAQDIVDSGKAYELFRDGNYEQALTAYESLRPRFPEAQRD